MALSQQIKDLIVDARAGGKKWKAYNYDWDSLMAQYDREMSAPKPVQPPPVQTPVQTNPNISPITGLPTPVGLNPTTPLVPTGASNTVPVSTPTPKQVTQPVSTPVTPPVASGGTVAGVSSPVASGNAAAGITTPPLQNVNVTAPVPDNVKEVMNNAGYTPVVAPPSPIVSGGTVAGAPVISGGVAAGTANENPVVSGGTSAGEVSNPVIPQPTTPVTQPTNVASGGVAAGEANVPATYASLDEEKKAILARMQGKTDAENMVDLKRLAEISRLQDTANGQTQGQTTTTPTWQERLESYKTDEAALDKEIERVMTALGTGIGGDGKPLNVEAAKDWLSKLMAVKAGFGGNNGNNGSNDVTDSYKMPDIIVDGTEIPQYKSPYDKEIADALSKLGNMKPYESQYGNLINNIISKLMNSQFTYNPSQDAQFQSASKELTRKVMEEMNRRGILNSTITADRVSQEIAQMMPQYQQLAEQRFNNDLDRQLAVAGFLQRIDSEEYSRYTDQYTKLKDAADFILKLDDRALNLYETQLDNWWKAKDFSYNEAQDKIEQQRKAITDAWERVNNLGYVDNESSIVLGVPVGTLSYDAQKTITQRQQQLDDYERELKDQKAQDLTDFNQQKEIIGIQAKNAQEQADAKAAKEADDKRIETELKEGTPEQQKNYSTLISAFAGNKTTAAEDLKYVLDHPGIYYEANGKGYLGKSLYTQLVNKLTDDANAEAKAQTATTAAAKKAEEEAKKNGTLEQQNKYVQIVSMLDTDSKSPQDDLEYALTHPGDFYGPNAKYDIGEALYNKLISSLAKTADVQKDKDAAKKAESSKAESTVKKETEAAKKAEEEKKKTELKEGTFQQQATYTNLIQGFANNGKSASENLKYVLDHPGVYYEPDGKGALGKALYDKLVAKLKYDVTIEKSSNPEMKSTDYKTNPDFAEDVNYINENPGTAYEDIKANATELIAKYGYAGYKELLDLANPLNQLR